MKHSNETSTWGQDLSGSPQGAGGVGGLLSVKDLSASQPASFSVLYDGNGNVSEYLDATGAIAAHFEYDAFGKTVVKTGPKTNDFEHQFSTKLLDASSGLHYYGYRYYDANSGRWVNRDPIQEKGGYNIYGFVGNDGVNWIDLLGLARYEHDNKGFHVHDGFFNKLTYGLKFNDDGSIEPISVKGHEKEFDADKAKKHLKKALCDKDELKKMRKEFADAWDKFNDKDDIADKGRGLRRFAGRFRSSGGAVLGIVIGALMIDPAEGATKDLINTLKTIQGDLEVGNHPDNLDVVAATALIQQIGGNFAALLLLDKLDKLEPCCPEDE